MKIEIYTDGSATTSDKPGGWGAVIVIDGVFYKEYSGYLEKATNNDAELIAAIKVLEHVLAYVYNYEGLKEPEQFNVILISDSQIVLNWANGTYRFKQTDKIFSYEALRTLVKELNAKTKWVRGHSGEVWNERCDKLANMARLGVTEETTNNPRLMNTKIGTKRKDTVSLWYKGQLKVLDFETGIIEDYDREAHGKRGSVVEIREEKTR